MNEKNGLRAFEDIFGTMGKYIVLFSFFLAICGCKENTAGIPDADYTTSFFDCLKLEKAEVINLAFDLAQLFNHVEDEKKIPATLTLPNSTQRPIPVHMSTRGVTRKKICSFPPLHIRFSKKVLRENQWADYRKYKLVTHCFFENTEEDKILLKEFLIYKMFEKMTSWSFRTHLIKVKYQLRNDTLSHFGFIIEHEDELMDRLNSAKSTNEYVDVENLPLTFYQKFVLFQYMIGNTDWNLSQRHNIKVLQASSSSPIRIVPYDFDYCGLVNASYATPHPRLPIHNVRERFFQYRGDESDDFSEALQAILDLRKEFVSIINHFPYLDQASKQEMIDYIAEFYDVLALPDWKKFAYANHMKLNPVKIWSRQDGVRC